MAVERFDFPNRAGERLAAVLDRPEGAVHAWALFAHCFTCGKDNLAAGRIARRLAERGIGVLRFDFTGLGASQGEFANTHFTSNVADLLSAGAALAERCGPPAVVIGHSLGGAAVLAAAPDIPGCRAVVTIAAPADPAHVTGLFGDQLAELDNAGEVAVTLTGRAFRIRREFIDDVQSQNLAPRIAGLGRPLLVFHAPGDQTVGIDNAAQIYTAARHPKSFISLPGADHLLSARADAVYVADVVAVWVERYLANG